MKSILSLLTVLFLSGCGEKAPSLQKWVGSEVTVHFRGDSMGAAGAPIGVATTWLNNSMISLNGKIVTAHPDGIYLDSLYKANSGDSDSHHSIFWIPTESILTVQMAK